jgi:hypothetical protein
VAKQGNQITFTQTSNRLLELTEPSAADLLLDAGFEVGSGRAGWLTRYDREARKGCTILVDPKRQELQFAQVEPLYHKGIFLRVLERHHITSPVGASFKLSVVHSRDYQMVFVNDVLAATFSFARRDAGVVGLFMENATGKCVVKGLHARPAQ